jgi:hypothetical protein
MITFSGPEKADSFRTYKYVWSIESLTATQRAKAAPSEEPLHLHLPTTQHSVLSRPFMHDTSQPTGARLTSRGIPGEIPSKVLEGCGMTTFYVDPGKANSHDLRTGASTRRV